MISSLELARLCGVAQATVDRAIHNRPGIAPKTRQRILREAAKHGYRANPVASELLRGDSRVVGAVAPLFGRVFFNDLLAAIAVELATRDQRLFVAPVEDEAGFFDAVHEFAARRVRAMVVIPPGSGLTLTRKQAGGAPVASLISPCGDYPKFISPDEQQTGVDAVEYLMRRGHRRIVHVTFARSAYAVEQRTAGYARAMQQHDCTPVVLRQADEAAILRTLREHRPTAWFCHNDWLAVRLLSVLHAAGMLRDGIASSLTAASFASVFAPKVQSVFATPLRAR